MKISPDNSQLSKTLVIWIMSFWIWNTKEEQ